MRCQTRLREHEQGFDAVNAGDCDEAEIERYKDVWEARILIRAEISL